MDGKGLANNVELPIMPENFLEMTTFIVQLLPFMYVFTIALLCGEVNIYF